MLYYQSRSRKYEYLIDKMRYAKVQDVFEFIIEEKAFLKIM